MRRRASWLLLVACSCSAVQTGTSGQSAETGTVGTADAGGTASADGSTSNDPDGSADASSTASGASTGASAGTGAADSTGADGCAGATADCDGDASDCEVDLATDAQHCGACGHGCLGGTCERQLCQPILLAEGDADDGLAVDDTYVYWVTDVNGGKIMRVPKTGGAAQELGDSEFGYDYQSMLVTATHVYWVEGSGPYTLVRIPKAGGPREAIVPMMYNDDYVVDDARIYYGDGALKSIPVDGGTVASHVGTTNVYSLAQDETHVYIAGYASLQRMDKATEATEYIVLDGVQAWLNLLAQGDRLFWSDSYAAFPPCDMPLPVVSIAKDGTGLQSLAELGKPDYLAVGDDALYIAGCKDAGVAGVDEVIVQVPHGGAPQEIVQATASGPDRIAVDADAIYWVTGFEVYRLAK